MTLLLYFSAFVAFGVAMVARGIVAIRAGGSYYSDIKGTRRSNVGAGIAMLFIGWVSLCGSYPMGREVAPRLLWVTASMIAPLASLWALTRALSATSAEQMLEAVRARLDEGHAPCVIQITGRSLIHDMVRAGIGIANMEAAGEAPGYRAPPAGSDYDARIGAAIETARRRGLTVVAALAAPCITPLAALAYFTLDAQPLEPLGWQILAGCAAATGLCSFTGWRLLRQVRLIAHELPALLRTARHDNS